MKKPEEIKSGLAECSAPDDGKAHCSMCSYYADGNGEVCIRAMTGEALSYIKQLEVQVPKWISVDNPPQKEGEYIVIVQTADGKKERMWDVFHPNHGWCENGEGNKVLYWMSFDSLPEPPKEG